MVITPLVYPPIHKSNKKDNINVDGILCICNMWVLSCNHGLKCPSYYVIFKILLIRLSPNKNINMNIS